MNDRYEEIYESFINGQKKQLVSQLDESEEIADFLRWVKENHGPEKVADIAISYFTIKGR